MADVERPLSPHLQVYRPQITSVLSIFHRMTGVMLVLGALLVVWWVVAAAAGPDYYAMVMGWLTSWLGLLVLLGFTWAILFHLCNGIRHLFWDAGYGYELEAVDRSGWVVLIGSAGLTVLVWIAATMTTGG